MPGINTTGKPNTGDLYLGRGSVELASINSSTGLPYDFRQVGNATAFALNVETETLEHQSSRSGIRAIDREIILQQKVGITLTIDEIMNFDNLANFLSGSASTVTNPATANAATGVTVSTAPVGGRSYDLLNDVGERVYDITGTVVTSVGVETTDYELDRTWGTIFIVPGGALDGVSFTWTYTIGGEEATIDEVTMLTQTKQSVYLRFKAINPANNDRQMLVDLHSVSLSADGDLSLIGEEFGELTLTGVAERNETGFPTAPTGRIYYHNSAV